MTTAHKNQARRRNTTTAPVDLDPVHTDATTHARRFLELKAKRIALAAEIARLKQAAKELRAEIAARGKELAQAVAEQDAAAEAAAELLASAPDEHDVRRLEVAVPDEVYKNPAEVSPAQDADPASAFVDVTRVEGLQRFDVYSDSAPDNAWRFVKGTGYGLLAG